MEIVKCPHCEKFIQSLVINKLDAEYRQPGVRNTDKIQCAVYSCPLCAKAISIQEDPIASKKSIVTAITSLLRGH
ncbi:hypothetical protein F6R98_10360 [Candidatus Methylospira mobilis]|uniref:Uncharacterized protein n=1 Tax=Candidatus Methylospira mobilis TaxID=1808979 RepID=A0A5Q0BMK4_9GAMM|nr:hypothetical protein [Candidatus Methylospira mobilis]QFY42966.1 hypothetical protein F6R98_10360 [Candidatus Methylospira mobilis]